MDSQKVVAWVQRWHRREQQTEIESLLVALTVVIVYAVTSQFVDGQVEAIAMAAALGVPLYLAIRFYVIGLLNRPVSYDPSTKPIHDLSLYDLHIEKEKAQHRGDATRVIAIEAEMRARQ